MVELRNDIPPEDRHERTDAKLAVAVWFGIGVVVLTGGALFGMYALFESLETAADERDQVALVTEGAVETDLGEQPPSPAEQLQDLREYEQSTLESYQWVDRTKGTVRIPIEKAMEIIVERGSARGGTGGAR